MSRHAHIAPIEKHETHFTEDTHAHDGHESLAPTGTRGTDNEKGSSRYASSEAGLAHKKGVSAAERKLLIKMGEYDLHRIFVSSDEVCLVDLLIVQTCASCLSPCYCT